MTKLLKDYNEYQIWLPLLLTIMLCLSKCNPVAGQTYTYWGTYKIDSCYTISFNFKGGYNFDRERGAEFWEMGDQSLTMAYPNLTYTTGSDNFIIELNGIEQKGYYYFKDSTKSVNITCQYDWVTHSKRVYVDNHLIGQKTINLPKIDKSLALTTNPPSIAEYDKFWGSETNMACLNYLTVFKTVANSTPIWRVNDYPVGYVPGSGNYDSVRSAFDQLSRYPMRSLTGTEATANCVNMGYLASGDGSISATTTLNAVALQRLLTTKYNYEIRVAETLNEYYAYRNVSYSIPVGMIALAKELTGAVTSFGSAWAQIDPIGSIVPYNNVAHITPSTDISVITPDQSIYRIQAQSLHDALAGRKIDRMWEDDEVMPHMTNFNNPISSQTYVKFVNYVLQPIHDLFPGTSVTEYDIHSPWFYNDREVLFSERIKISTTGLGTIQHYPRFPDNWRMWNSADRGVGFYLRSKYEEIAEGHELNTAFVCWGWDKVEENNIHFAQALGLCKILKVAGSKYFYASYFTITQSGIQNSKGYCWQLSIPPYTEAAVVGYKNIIENGTLLPGDNLISWYYGNAKPQSEYNFYTGDKSVFCVVRQLGASEYLIATTYQPLNNYVGQPNKKTAIITLNGAAMHFDSRRQGSIYYFNSATHVFKQIDGWQRGIHPDRGW
jgi:hypothetical protein